MAPYHHTSGSDVEFKYFRLNHNIEWSAPVNDNRMPRSEKVKRIMVIVMVLGLLLWLLMY